MKKIWIDLDNTPHVPFFKPVLAELRRRGYPVLVTARDAFQVCELADASGIEYRKVGRHHGKNKVRKIVGLFVRASQLLPLALGEKPVLGVSHGSRAQMIVCTSLGIPTIGISDYEHGKELPIFRPRWQIFPEVVPNSAIPGPVEFIRKYPGIKEDVYVPRFQPDPGFLAGLGLSAADLVVTVRPPATEAHYHNPEAEGLFDHVMRKLAAHPEVRTVLLPRNKRQEEEIKARCPEWFANDKAFVPKRAVDGLNLLWNSDLVVSGGGTMNREAVALGVPVYSIFRGPMGAVDRYLSSEGRLIMLASNAEVDQKLQLLRRDKNPASRPSSAPALDSVLKHIEEIVARS